MIKKALIGVAFASMVLGGYGCTHVYDKYKTEKLVERTAQRTAMMEDLQKSNPVKYQQLQKLIENVAKINQAISKPQNLAMVELSPDELKTAMACDGHVGYTVTRRLNDEIVGTSITCSLDM